jgi:exodeoxyribonuclease VII large subunit
MVEHAENQTAQLRSHLRALSPQGTLDRGYAIAQLPDGHVLRSPEQAPAGTELLLTLAEGTAKATSK